MLYAFQILQLVRCLQPAVETQPEPRREEGTGSTGAIKIRFKTQGDKFSA